MDKADRDYGEWLYAVTWLDYEKNGRGELVGLVDAPLVAECEWGNEGDIEDNFEKLLLARTGARLMIFNGYDEPGSKGIAERLANAASLILPCIAQRIMTSNETLGQIQALVERGRCCSKTRVSAMRSFYVSWLYRPCSLTVKNRSR